MTMEMFLHPITDFYRVLHDYEIYKVRQVNIPPQYDHVGEWDWRAKNGFPEVYWLENSHQVPLGKEWQLLIQELNPHMDGNKLRTTWDFMRAFSNGLNKGFDTRANPVNPPYAPIPDYFTNRDLNASGSLTKDKVRVSGGMTLRGKREGDYIVVETMHPDAVPTLKWLLAHPWLYFHAVTCHKTSAGLPTIAPFTQGGGKPVLIPLVARFIVYIPIQVLEPVGKMADPYEIYLT